MSSTFSSITTPPSAISRLMEQWVREGKVVRVMAKVSFPKEIVSQPLAESSVLKFSEAVKFPIGSLYDSWQPIFTDHPDSVPATEGNAITEITFSYEGKLEPGKG